LKLSKKENGGEISPNILSKRNLITKKQNQVLRKKLKELEQQKQAQERIITNLKNNKKALEKSLIQVKNEKHTLLKLLSNDLQKQNDQLLKQTEKPVIQELHQQLIAKIEISLKN
jgi:DNA-directed RNA polymerase subunit L